MACAIFSPMEYLMERDCENLSGGGMQMVAIARALVGSPDLFPAAEIALPLPADPNGPW